MSCEVFLGVAGQRHSPSCGRGRGEERSGAKRGGKREGGRGRGWEGTGFSSGLSSAVFCGSFEAVVEASVGFRFFFDFDANVRTMRCWGWCCVGERVTEHFREFQVLYRPRILLSAEMGFFVLRSRWETR